MYSATIVDNIHLKDVWASNTWSLLGMSEQGAMVAESAIFGDLDLNPNSSQSAYSVSKMHFPIPIGSLSTLSVSSLCPSQSHYAIFNPNKPTTATHVPFSPLVCAKVSAKCAHLSPYYVDLDHMCPN